MHRGLVSLEDVSRVMKETRVQDLEWILHGLVGLLVSIRAADTVEFGLNRLEFARNLLLVGRYDFVRYFPWSFGLH